MDQQDALFSISLFRQQTSKLLIIRKINSV